MAPQRGLAKLVSHKGRTVRWADVTLRPHTITGYLMGIDCAFCDRPMIHYIGRDTKGRACWMSSGSEYIFANADEAFAARDELAAQQEGE